MRHSSNFSGTPLQELATILQWAPLAVQPWVLRDGDIERHLDGCEILTDTVVQFAGDASSFSILRA